MRFADITGEITTPYRTVQHLGGAVLCLQYILTHGNVSEETQQKMKEAWDCFLLKSTVWHGQVGNSTLRHALLAQNLMVSTLLILTLK